MADYRNTGARTVPVAGSRVDASIDQGLRAYMLKVYNLMAAGLALTGVAAYSLFSIATTSDPNQAVAQINDTLLTSTGVAIYQSPLQWVLMLAPLAFVFFLSFRVHRMSVGAAQATFWLYAALVGLSLSSIFIIFTPDSIVQTFFATAAAFGALSLYGYTTRRDISGWGSFLFMGVIGIIIASLLNIFIASDALAWAISIIGVLVFAGLTAYDTQRIKEMYYVGDDAAVAGRKAVMGALTLYLDFINMFMFLLQLFGNRE
jgi:uncharacterized protein